MVVKELFARLGLDMDGASFEAADALIGGLGLSLAAVGAAVAGMAAALAAGVKATADQGDAAKKLAAQAGVSVEAIQALGYAADFSGSSAEELGQALNFLAKKGSKDVEGDFKRMADRVAGMADGGEKSALAIETFGRAGARLIPLLNEGSTGLERFRKEAEELGYTMSAKMAADSETMNDSVDRVNKAFAGLRNQALGPLIPMVTKLADRFVEWIKLNREMIQSRLNKVIGFTVTAVRLLWKAVRVVSAVLETMIDHWKLIAIILGSVVLTAIYANIGALASQAAMALIVGNAMVATAIKSAAAWALANLPLFAMIGIFILIGLLIEDVWTALSGGDSLIEELGGKWTAFLDSWFADSDGDGWFMTALKAIVWLFSDLATTIPAALGEWGALFGRFFTWIGEGFYSMGRDLQDFFAGIAEWIGEKVRAMVGVIKAPLDAVSETFRGFGGWLGEKIHGKGAGAPSGLAGASQSLPADSLGANASGFSEAAQGLSAGSVPAMFSGGAASPMAAAEGNANANKAPISLSPSFDMGGVTIHAAPGDDATANASKVREQMEDFHNAKMREAYAASGG